MAEEGRHRDRPALRPGDDGWPGAVPTRRCPRRSRRSPSPPATAQPDAAWVGALPAEPEVRLTPDQRRARADSALVELVEILARAPGRVRLEGGADPPQPGQAPPRGDLRDARGDRLTGDSTDHLREELGDVLLQVYFHAAIAAEAGALRHRGRRWRPAREDAPAQPARLRRRRGDRPRADQRALGGGQGRGEAARPVCSTASRSTLPALQRAAKVLDRLERAGAACPRRDPRPSSATGCWRSWPRRGRRAWTPSRRCATPYDAVST